MASTVLLDLPLHGLSLCAVSIAILFSVLLSTLLLFRFHPNRSSTRSPKLPPSPPRLPVIGNLHQLRPLPHKSLRALSREHGPLMLLKLGQVPTLVVSSAEMAEEILKAHDLTFASRPLSTLPAVFTGGRGIGFAPYGGYWRQARKTCVVHLLSSHRVQAFRPAREEEVARLVGKISEQSSSGDAINMSMTLSLFTNSLVCRAAVGRSAMEEETTRYIRDLVVRTSTVAGVFQVENFFPSLPWLRKFTGVDAKLAELLGRWRALFRRLAGRRGADTAEDRGLLDVLLSLQMDTTATGFAPTRDEIDAILVGLITAGTDTSYLILEAALEELLKNPAAMKKAQEEVRGAVQGKPTVAEEDVSRMGYLKTVIKETLRLHPPAPLLLPRESVKAVQILGYEIPAKTRVLINAWAIARDPDYWESPEEFRPERFLSSSIDFRGNDFQFIPFGAGRRICPGMHFAVATIELALANLLYHFNWSQLEGMSVKDCNMEAALGLTVRRRQGLFLAVKPNSSQGEPEEEEHPSKV